MLHRSIIIVILYVGAHDEAMSVNSLN